MECRGEEMTGEQGREKTWRGEPRKGEAMTEEQGIEGETWSGDERTAEEKSSYHVLVNC